MNVERVIIVTDKEFIVVDPFDVRLEHNWESIDYGETELTCKFTSAKRIVPKTVYIIWKYVNKLKVYERTTKYDLTKCDEMFGFGDCPHSMRMIECSVNNIIWDRTEAKKALDEFESFGYCICASKEVAESVVKKLEQKDAIDQAEKLTKEIESLKALANELKKTIKDNAGLS